MGSNIFSARRELKKELEFDPKLPGAEEAKGTLIKLK